MRCGAPPILLEALVKANPKIAGEAWAAVVTEAKAGMYGPESDFAKAVCDSKVSMEDRAAIAPNPGVRFVLETYTQTFKKGIELFKTIKDKYSSDDDVLRLLRQCPSAACYSHKRSALLLVVAMQHKASEEVVLEILRCCPQAASVQNSRMFPVHHALKNMYSTAVIAALVRTNPPSILAAIDNSMEKPYYQYIWDKHVTTTTKMPSNLNDPTYRSFWEVISCSLNVAHYSGTSDQF
jgi:hypothetical protein